MFYEGFCTSIVGSGWCLNFGRRWDVGRGPRITTILVGKHLEAKDFCLSEGGNHRASHLLALGFAWTVQLPPLFTE